MPVALQDRGGPVDLGSLFELENDLPDELIPNGGDLGLGSMPSNGGGGVGLDGMVPDAATKHKQLSELLRAGSSPNLGPLGKSPLGQGSPTHPSQAQKQAGGHGPGHGPGHGFGQPHVLLGQGPQPQQGQAMNGTLGPGGAPGPAPMQYQGQGPAAGGGAAGSALAETLTGAPQMGAHGAMNAQQGGNMNKMGLSGPTVRLGSSTARARGSCWGRGSTPSSRTRQPSPTASPFPTDLKGATSVPNLSQIQQQPQQHQVPSVGVVPGRACRRAPRPTRRSAS
ncbi:hypothetical protein ANANG_G00292990 [Anguilla anguilla]|uniref:Uncharacterized protein n=1 Tax=Anguilla anguilla TaxID=7936 RepID=A0A9D3RJ81_ANGAN|nr:hypothetical protein ANANG_G00292990 [Anguilla anguilla]